MVLSLLFTSTAVSADEILQIKFKFVNTGSCLVTCGDVYNPLWEDVGDGALMLSGKADGEYYEQPVDGIAVLKGYMMENLAVKGCLLLRWNEDDSSKHWVSVTFYSTATSRGVYFYDPVILGTISIASDQSKDYIRFEGLYYDGQEIQKISGAALLMIMQTIEGCGVCMQLYDDTTYPLYEHSMFRAIWSEIETQEIPAAQVFMWNVEIKTP